MKEGQNSGHEYELKLGKHQSIQSFNVPGKNASIWPLSMPSKWGIWILSCWGGELELEVSILKYEGVFR